MASVDPKAPTEHSDSNADAAYWANVAKYVVGAGFILWMMSSQWTATKQTVQSTSGGQTFVFVAAAALVAFGAPRAPKGTGTFVALLAAAYLYQSGVANGALEVFKDFVAPTPTPAVQQPSAPQAPRVMPPKMGRLYRKVLKPFEPKFYSVCNYSKSADGAYSFQLWGERNDSTVDLVCQYDWQQVNGEWIGICREPVRGKIDMRLSPQSDFSIEDELTTKFVDGKHRKVYLGRWFLRQNPKKVEIFYLELFGK